MVLLAEKYQLNNQVLNSQEYFTECSQLMSKYVPEFAVYQQELKKVGERFSKPVIEGKAAKARAGRKKK